MPTIRNYIQMVEAGGPGSGRRPGGGGDRRAPERRKTNFGPPGAAESWWKKDPRKGDRRMGDAERRTRKNSGGIKRGFDRGYQNDSYR